jgi:hypothetical protein
LLALVVLSLGARSRLAFQDTHDWARSARAGEEEVERARAAVARAEPGPGPVLFAGFPRGRFEANCFTFGVADRFRAPFPVSPRPVWPWRNFSVDEEARARSPLFAPRADGSVWPLDDVSPLPPLALRTDAGEAVARVLLDERAIHANEDRSPRYRVSGRPVRGSRACLAELGCGRSHETQRRRLSQRSLMQFLDATNGAVSVSDARQAADLRAERAFLELRAFDSTARQVAASRWIEVGWPREPSLLSGR